MSSYFNIVVLFIIVSYKHSTRKFTKMKTNEFDREREKKKNSSWFLFSTISEYVYEIYLKCYKQDLNETIVLYDIYFLTNKMFKPTTKCVHFLSLCMQSGQRRCRRCRCSQTKYMIVPHRQFPAVLHGHFLGALENLSA